MYGIGNCWITGIVKAMVLFFSSYLCIQTVLSGSSSLTNQEELWSEKACDSCTSFYTSSKCHTHPVRGNSSCTNECQAPEQEGEEGKETKGKGRERWELMPCLAGQPLSFVQLTAECLPVSNLDNYNIFILLLKVVACQLFHLSFFLVQSIYKHFFYFSKATQQSPHHTPLHAHPIPAL